MAVSPSRDGDKTRNDDKRVENGRGPDAPALLRAEIANTVANPEEVDEELRALFEALS